MKHRRQDERRAVGCVLRGLVVAAALQFAIGPANAQTTAPVDVGPSAPTTEKAEPAQQPPTPPPVVVVSATEAKPDGFTIGSFVFKPGGRIKLDIIRDFDVVGSEDSFDPRTIDLNDSEGGNSQIHARETRLSLDMRGPIEGKELRMYIETDFYGSGSVFRLRHAYGTWGGLLAGQTWSNFLDDANFPNTIDFESPMAFPSIRQAQVRFTAKPNANVTWAASVEDNKSSIELPTGRPGKAEYPMPDLTTSVRFGGGRGHVFGSLFVGKGRFRPTDGEPDDVTLWGSLLSARVKTFGRDYAYTQFTFGDGVGRYRGGITAVPDFNGELQPVGIVAWLLGYEHYWSPVVSTNAVFSVASTENEDYYADAVNKDLNYGAVNLLYWFLPDRAWAGVEYLYGRREVFGGQVGTANRMQFAVRFNFP